MITLNKRFSFEKDPYRWVLHEWYDGHDKKKNVVRKSRTSYYSSLRQICKEVIDRSAGECESMTDLIYRLDNIVKDMTVHAEKQSGQDYER